MCSVCADWDDLQTLKWAQTVDPHQSEECELLLETYSMQFSSAIMALTYHYYFCSHCGYTHSHHAFGLHTRSGLHGSIVWIATRATPCQMAVCL